MVHISDVDPEMQLLKKKWQCQFKIWCDPFSIAFQYVKLNLLHAYDKCLGTILKFSPPPLARHVLWLQQAIKQAQKVTDFRCQISILIDSSVVSNYQPTIHVWILLQLQMLST